MAIFSLLAKLGLDTAEFRAGVKRAESAAAGLGRSINGHVGGEIRGFGTALAGVFTVGAVAKFASSIADTVGEIKDMSELLGISTDQVQRLMKASEEAGQPFSKIVAAFQKVEGMRAKALVGDDKATKLFNILGIDPSKSQPLEIIARAIEASGRGVKENAAAFELLGAKVGSVRVIIDELNKNTPINLINPEAIQKIDEASKAIERLKKSIMSGTAGAAGNFLANVGIAAKAVEAHTEAEFLAQQKGLSGEEARRFRLDYMGREVMKMRMENLGIPIPLQDSQKSSSGSDQDAAIDLLRKMELSTRRTSEILEQRTAE